MTGAPIIQLCQMQALSASSRCTIRAHSPAGTRPPWRSRPSWFFRVQMIASTRCRSQFGKVPGSLLVLAGRADQGQAQVVAGEELLGVLAGQALVGGAISDTGAAAVLARETGDLRDANRRARAVASQLVAAFRGRSKAGSAGLSAAFALRRGER